jgi:hypothetical protein
VEESGALHNKNNDKSIIPNPQIEQGDKQDCVIEDGVFHDNLSKNSISQLCMMCVQIIFL